MATIRDRIAHAREYGFTAKVRGFSFQTDERIYTRIAHTKKYDFRARKRYEA